MKTFILLLTISTLLACSQAPKSTVLTIASTAVNTEDSIIQLFNTWKENELKIGHYVLEEYCNSEWMLAQYEREDYSKNGKPTMGFPTESGGFGFSFSDLNKDGKLDGMISFSLLQCDGGNGSMWSVNHVFILSGKNDYAITDTINFSSFENNLFEDRGFFTMENISESNVFGTYIAFLEEDGHCCPSIVRPVVFDYMKRKLLSVGDNVSEN